jgi:hypothetical protein
MMSKDMNNKKRNANMSGTGKLQACRQIFITI